MQLAFCLYKYFPFGGMQRDFLRIALACQARSHDIRVYAIEWEGEVPPGFELVRVPVSAMFDHRLCTKFAQWVEADLAQRPADRIVGFNAMPGLDFYYAADPCYEEAAQTTVKSLYRYSPHHRQSSTYENAVFAPESRTAILTISATQQPVFRKHYGTPAKRFHLLPPGIARDRRAPANASERRVAARARFATEFKLQGGELLLVQIGSDFMRKGLDRTIEAMAALPEPLKRRTRLIAIGADDPTPFISQAARLGVGERVFMPGGRKDIPDFLLAADLLVHPARHEITGAVLLEALVSGLPVLASAACGYAHYVVEADAGTIIGEPFHQDTLNDALAAMLGTPDALSCWQRNALVFANSADLHSLPERAADIITGGRG